MRKLLTIKLVLVAVAFFFGFERAWSYVKASRRIVNEHVDQHAPMRLESARIKELLTANECKINDFDVKIARAAWQVQDLDHRIQDLAQRVAQEERLLAHVRDLLDQELDSYVVAGRSYTRHEIDQDALARAQALEGLRAQQEVLRHDRQVQQDAIQESQKLLAQARAEQARLLSGFQGIEARNLLADVRLELAQTRAALSTPTLTSDELGRALNNYNNRVREKNLRADQMLNQATGAIDYARDLPSQSGREAIDRVLSPATQPVPAQAG